MCGAACWVERHLPFKKKTSAFTTEHAALLHGVRRRLSIFEKGFSSLNRKCCFGPVSLSLSLSLEILNWFWNTAGVTGFGVGIVCLCVRVCGMGRDLHTPGSSLYISFLPCHIFLTPPQQIIIIASFKEEEVVIFLLVRAELRWRLLSRREEQSEFFVFFFFFSPNGGSGAERFQWMLHTSFGLCHSTARLKKKGACWV